MDNNSFEKLAEKWGGRIAKGAAVVALASLLIKSATDESKKLAKEIPKKEIPQKVKAQRKIASNDDRYDYVPPEASYNADNNSVENRAPQAIQRVPQYIGQENNEEEEESSVGFISGGSFAPSNTGLQVAENDQSSREPASEKKKNNDPSRPPQQFCTNGPCGPPPPPKPQPLCPSGNCVNPPEPSTPPIVDTTPAEVAITVSPAIHAGNHTSYTFSGTCSEDGRDVDYDIGGVIGNTSCTSSSWSVTIDVSALADNPTLAITADHSDAAGNMATQAIVNVVKDVVIPTISNITSSKADNTYTIGEVIDIDVTFSEAITTSSSTLSLDSGGTASYQSGSGTATITYRYTVAASENSSDLTVSTFNVGDAADDGTNAVDNTIPSGGAGNGNLAVNKALVIDTTVPTISNITSSKADGTYTTGEVIDIDVTFSEAITTSSSTLSLDSGGSATYQSGSGTTTVTYRYTVVASENSSDLTVSTFNIGDAADSATNAVNATIPSGGAGNDNLAFAKALVIDTGIPTIVSFESTTPDDGTYTSGQDIDIIVTFSEAVTTSTSTLSLDTGGTANYQSGSGSSTVTYRYTVAGGHTSSDLAVTAFTVGDAADAGSNAVDNTLPTGQNLSDNNNIIIDTTQPTITNISSALANGTYGIGQDIDIVVTFSETVITSTSTLSLDSGGSASYLSGSGSTTVTYRYTVAATENSSDLNVTAFNIGDAADTGSNAVSSTLPTGGTPGNDNLAFSKALVIDTNQASITNITSSDADQTYTNADVIDIDVTFDEAITTSNSTLTLDSGGTASYQAGSGTTTITYRYTVGASDNSSDLAVTAFNLGDALDGGSNAPATALPALNNLDDNKNLVIDNTAPIITNITSLKNDVPVYTVGEQIDIDVTFDEIVNTATSTLTLDSGGTAVYQSGSGTTTITYRYTVGASQNSSDLAVTAFNVNDADNVVSIAASSTLPAGQNLDDNKNLVIDTTAPTITEINSAKANGNYTTGEQIDIDVTFSEAVTTGTSSLTLDSGGTAVYQSGSGTTTVTYRYTVGATDTTSDLNVSAFVVGDAADVATNAVSTTLPVGDNLADNKAIVIDTDAATITNITSAKADNTYGVGEVIDIVVTFSENIDTNTSSLTLDNGATATLQGGPLTGVSSATYRYTVGASQDTTDLNVTTFNVGDAVDGASNAVSGALPAGQNLADNKALVIDTSDAIITNISSAKADNTYGIGEVIDIDVTFDEAVTVGTSTLTLDNGATASYQSGTGTTTIRYRYTVGASEDSSDLNVTAFNVGTAEDQYGNSVSNTLPAGQNLADNKALVIDTSGPTVTEVNSAEADGYYNALEDSLEIQVIFSENITVGGAPTLTLETGTTDRVATFDRVDSGNIAVFLYDVQVGDESLDLDYVNTTSLSLNGGSIQDASLNNADLTLAVPGATDSLSDNRAIVIDAIVPTITDIASTVPGDGTYTTGQDIDIIVTFSEAVTTATSTLTLDTGGTASYLSGSGTTTVTYRYTVAGTHNTSDLNVTAFTVGDAADAGSNAVDNSLPGSANLEDNNDIIIDTTQATITNIASTTPGDGAYTTGQDIDIIVTFSEAVTTSTSTLTLDTGGTASYLSGSGTTTVTYRYTVAGTHNTADLAVTAFTVGDAVDGASIAVSSTLPGSANLDDNNDIVIDTVQATITDISSAKANGVYQSPEVIDIVVTFSEAITTSSSSLTLDTGATASYLSGSGTTTVTYRYTVGASETSEDLSVTAFNVGDAQDVGTIAPDTTLPTSQNLDDNKNIAIADGLLTLNVYVRESTCSAGTPANPDLCYTTLTQALADFNDDSALSGSFDLVSNNVTVLIHIQDSWTSAETTRPDVAGSYISDSTRHITIQTEGAARHSGVANAVSGANTYRIANSSSPSMYIWANYAVVDGIEVTGGNRVSIGTDFGNSVITIKNSIFHNFAAQDAISVSDLLNGPITLNLENMIIYDIPGSAVHVEVNGTATSGQNVNIDNSIFHNVCLSTNTGTLAYESGVTYTTSNMVVRNSYIGECIAAGGADRGLVGPISFAGSDYNLHFHDTVIGSNSMSNVQITDSAPGSYNGNDYIIVSNLTSGSENLHLTVNAFNKALGFGTDLTGTIPNDIDGAAITGSEQQVGPDFITDTSFPEVEQVYITETDGTTIKPDGSYYAGETMSFIIEFSQVLDIGGTPQLTVGDTLNTTINCAQHSSIRNALKCDYTAPSGAVAADLDYLNTSSLALNGGSIDDNAGNAAILTLPTVNGLYSASDDQAIVLDAAAPVINTITSTSPGDGLYNTSDVIDIIVTFNKAVTTSTSSLTLDNGTTASYQSGSGTTAVTYRYTVGAIGSGEDTSDLNVSTFTVGDAVDAGSVAVDNTLPPGQNLADNQAIVIDVTRPTPLTLTSPTDGSSTTSTSVTMNGTCETGATVAISGAGVSGGPYTQICSAGAYSIGVTLTAGDGVKNWSIDQTDPAGNSMAAPLTGSYTLSSFFVTDITSTNSDGLYGETDVIDIVATFNKTITISGTPSITLDTGAVVNMTSSTATTITFQYTVGAGENSSDLSVVSMDPGTYIRDGLSNDAVLTLPISGAGNDLDEQKDIQVDTQAPAFVASSFVINSGATETQSVFLSVAFDATDNVSNVVDFCLKYTDATQPGSSDPCWKPLDGADPGVTPSNSVSVPETFVRIGFTPGTYTVYGFLRDGAGNVSTHTATAALDQDSINYIQNDPPYMNGILVTDTATPADPPTDAELVMPAGADVHIKWNITDDRGFATSPINLYYTTDGSTYTAITGGTSLDNGSNGGCTIDEGGTTADDSMTGCFVWSGGAPTSSFFKIRIEATDSDGVNSTAFSVPLNDTTFNVLAGNTDRNIGNAADSAIFSHSTGTSADVSKQTFVVMPSGDVYIWDVVEGIVKVDAVTGMSEVFLPKSGDSTYEGALGSAGVRYVNIMSLDYDYNLWIFDYDRFKKIDFDAGTITTIIGGGADTDPDNVAGATVDIGADENGASSHFMFNVLPDGRLFFTLTGGFWGSNDEKFYWWNPADSKVYRHTITGTGSSNWGSYNPSSHNCRLASLYMSHDLNRTTTSITELFYRADSAGGSCSSAPEFVNLDTTTWNISAPHPTSDPDSYYYKYGVKGMDGKIYAIDHHSDSSLWKWDEGTRQWSKILGGTGENRGNSCVDGMSALDPNCYVDVIDMFATETGQIYFNDGGAIRTIDEYGDVQTLYGQKLDFGDGQLATSARFGNIRNFDVWDNGGTLTVTLLDEQMIKFREFPVGGNINTILGTGVVGTSLNEGDDSSEALEGTSEGTHFVIHPTSGDVFFHNAYDDALMWDRSSDLWRNVYGDGGTAGWSASDGTAGSSIYFNGQYSPKPMAIDPTNRKVLYGENGYSGTTTNNSTIFTMDFNASYTSATFTYMLGQTGDDPGPSSGSRICSAGNSPASCVIRKAGAWDYGDDSGAPTSEYYPRDNSWLMHDRTGDQDRISKIKKSTNVADFTYLDNPARSFDYYDAGATEYIFYCGQDGNLYKRNVTAGTETTLTIATPGITCVGLNVQYDPGRDSLIFIFEEGGMQGIGEYLSP